MWPLYCTQRILSHCAHWYVPVRTIRGNEYIESKRKKKIYEIYFFIKILRRSTPSLSEPEYKFLMSCRLGIKKSCILAHRCSNTEKSRTKRACFLTIGFKSVFPFQITAWLLLPGLDASPPIRSSAQMSVRPFRPGRWNIKIRSRDVMQFNQEFLTSERVSSEFWFLRMFEGKKTGFLSSVEVQFLLQ